MLDQVVRNHSECTRLLLTHDAAGTNWRGDHYSGNFWWARAEHVRRLPDVRTLRTAPRPITADPTLNVRLQCEFWVSMARGRFANLGVAGLDLYQTIRWTVNAADVINDLNPLQLDGSDTPSYLALGVKGFFDEGGSSSL
jgi:hypothetical protein